MTIKVSENQIEQLSDKLDAIAESAKLAADAAKGSAGVAFQSSVENVKAYRAFEEKFDAYVLSSEKKFDAYVKADTARWAKYGPILEGLVNLTGSGKIILWIVLFVGSVIGTGVAIRNIFIK